MEPRRPRGVFNLVPGKRFGFITPDGGGEDVFAHLANVRAGHVVEDRNAVEYGIGRGPDGRDQAVEIVPVPSPPPPPSEASDDSGAGAYKPPPPKPLPDDAEGAGAPQPSPCVE